jgi:hypothetical protein
MYSSDRRSTPQYQIFGLHLTVLGGLVLWLDISNLRSLGGSLLVVGGGVIAVGSLGR